MSDQGRWFKLWTTCLNDPHLDNLDISDFGRWAKFGAFLKAHGNNGCIELNPPSRSLCAKLQVDTFDMLISCIKKFPNCSVSLETNVIVTWLNWHKYQGDFSSDRVRKFRQNETPKKRREEMRRDENKKRRENTNKNKKTYGEFSHVKLTDEEYQKLFSKLDGSLDLWIRTLDEGIEQKGYKYNSHYLTILKWYEKDQKTKPAWEKDDG